MVTFKILTNVRTINDNPQLHNTFLNKTESAQLENFPT